MADIYQRLHIASLQDKSIRQFVITMINISGDVGLEQDSLSLDDLRELSSAIRERVELANRLEESNIYKEDKELVDEIIRQVRSEVGYADRQILASMVRDFIKFWKFATGHIPSYIGDYLEHKK